METALEHAGRSALKARTIGVLGLANNIPPLVYADVGALWGVDNPLVQLLHAHKHLRVIGFEPEEAECKKLQTAHPNDIYLATGIGDVDGPRKFYVTSFNACSSFLEPDPDAFAGLPHRDLFNVVKTPELPMRRFDSLIAEGAVPQPDYLKIDAQGFELNVLKGCGDRLQSMLGVRLETQLRPMYRRQALFGDIYEFMRQQGFLLRDLRVTYPVAYEVVEIEAYFSRDPRGIGNKLAALRIWELLHDIPPGRTVAVKSGRIDWISLPL